ncbi:4-alpha-glucanotransferase dpe2, partial [Quercus suber]
MSSAKSSPSKPSFNQSNSSSRPSALVAAPAPPPTPAPTPPIVAPAPTPTPSPPIALHQLLHQPLHHQELQLQVKHYHSPHTMAKYFTAYRIDHILGFFRIWEFPQHSMTGLEELEREGIWDFDRLSRPYIRQELLQ